MTNVLLPPDFVSSVCILSPEFAYYLSKKEVLFHGRRETMLISHEGDGKRCWGIQREREREKPQGSTGGIYIEREVYKVL